MKTELYKGENDIATLYKEIELDGVLREGDSYSDKGVMYSVTKAVILDNKQCVLIKETKGSAGTLITSFLKQL